MSEFCQFCVNFTGNLHSYVSMCDTNSQALVGSGLICVLDSVRTGHLFGIFPGYTGTANPLQLPYPGPSNWFRCKLGRNAF